MRRIIWLTSMTALLVFVWFSPLSASVFCGDPNEPGYWCSWNKDGLSCDDWYYVAINTCEDYAIPNFGCLPDENGTTSGYYSCPL
jgi:hypothetical protein